MIQVRRVIRGRRRRQARPRSACGAGRGAFLVFCVYSTVVVAVERELYVHGPKTGPTGGCCGASIRLDCVS